MAQIVTVNVSQQLGATPNQFQRKGAIASVGGTTLTAGSSLLLTQAKDLTTNLAGSVAITTATWASGVVTLATATPHGLTSGDLVTVAGYTNTYAGYNVNGAVATVTGASGLTYPVVTSLPTPAVGSGVLTDQDVAQLVSEVTTFFAQGTGLGVYVLELGHGTIPTSVAALAAYITANPAGSSGSFYRYLVPRLWDADSTFQALVAQYSATTAKTYFDVTAQVSTYANFTAKSVGMMIEAPTIPATEFSMASRFWKELSYDPNPSNQVTPLQYSYLQAVTPYPITGSQSATFGAGNLDYVTTAAEGGISNKMLALGKMADGNPFNYWYSVDWMQLTADLRISNAIINGSNNPLAPLFYDQNGINQLSTVVQGVAASAIANGLAVGPVSAYTMTAAAFAAFLASGTAPVGVLVNAVPFVSYVRLNPSDYPIGNYGGLSMAYTPARGFSTIVFNIAVSNFIP
ncbi:MAG: hypothetical protein V4447_10670 [Pseudomonadota bacterium]